MIQIFFFHIALIRRCQFVRKTDECSLRVEFGGCGDDRKGICYTGFFS